MSKKTKQKGAAKAYATQQRQQDREASMQKRKAGSKIYQRPGPTPQRVLTVRIAGIAVMVAAVAGALALAIPYAGNYPIGITISLIVLGFVTGLGLFAAIRAREVIERFYAVRKR